MRIPGETRRGGRGESGSMVYGRAGVPIIPAPRGIISQVDNGLEHSYSLAIIMDRGRLAGEWLQGVSRGETHR